MISSERIIRMLNVHEGRLVVDEKGIYSIEKFIISRRLMYWQVYLHKTVLAAEWMMMRILERARESGPPQGERRVVHPGPGALPRRRTWTAPVSWPTRTCSPSVLRPGRQRRHLLRQSVAAITPTPCSPTSAPA